MHYRTIISLSRQCLFCRYVKIMESKYKANFTYVGFEVLMAVTSGFKRHVVS
jgi:hypothetical protein